ncbi:MAG: hypothetical protein U9O94_06360 [Nanoarchaeota archaeon]|nr:hypothetical protein [Nanoarchaeota archaeon]
MPNPKIEAIGKIAELLKGILGMFSAKEVRARRRIYYEGRVLKAIQREEQHYERLDEFIYFIEKLVRLDNREDEKLWKRYIRKFRQDKKTFLKLT